MNAGNKGMNSLKAELNAALVDLEAQHSRSQGLRSKRRASHAKISRAARVEMDRQKELELIAQVNRIGAYLERQAWAEGADYEEEE
jgi:hypothetical protein